MQLDENLKQYLSDRLCLDQFITSEEKKNFFAIISHYLLNRSTIETFIKNLEETVLFYEFVGVSYTDMIRSICNWPAVIHANKEELFIKYLLLADVVSYRTGELARDNILINHPKDLMTGLDTIYARIRFLQSEDAEVFLRNERITRRKVLKITHSEFEEIYRVDKESLLKMYPFTPDALEDIKEWELNRELVEKYEKKGRQY